MNNRREFVAAVGGATLSGMVAATPVWAAAKLLRRAGGSPDYEVFVGLLGQNLLLRSSTRGDFAVNLVKVREVPTKQRIEQFTIVLRGPAQLPLTAGLYDLFHESFGSLSLYLDPSGRDAFGLLYRSDFSLLI
jgi:hypothetical protein